MDFFFIFKALDSLNFEHFCYLRSLKVLKPFAPQARPETGLEYPSLSPGPSIDGAKVSQLNLQ